jgi:hypothetical protein
MAWKKDILICQFEDELICQLKVHCQIDKLTH